MSWVDSSYLEWGPWSVLLVSVLCLLIFVVSARYLILGVQPFGALLEFILACSADVRRMMRIDKSRMVPRDCGGDRGTSVGSDSEDGRGSSGRVTESYVLFEKPLPAECPWTDVLINVTDLPTAIDAIWSAVIENDRGNDRKSRYSEEDKSEGEPGLATTLNLLKRSCQEIRIVKLELSLEVDPDSDDEKTWAARAPTARKVSVEKRRGLVVRWFMLYKLLDGTFMFGGQPQVDGRLSSATTTGRSCPVNSGKVVPTTVVQEARGSSFSERSPQPAADESSNISTDAVECVIPDHYRGIDYHERNGKHGKVRGQVVFAERGVPLVGDDVTHISVMTFIIDTLHSLVMPSLG
ncbi:hypothetical protein FOL46_007152 [Perkinsus olseni]|uniref:Uncharacterized protein n=1 Tax=Perkinsus olseni TaxID=32597 RepID=A0A7J6LG62_PEROL|nr:hypothetical protein FOL46_007152 [Perkinsus olseni]